MSKSQRPVSLGDGVSYGRIYSAIEGLYNSAKVEESEPLCWDKTELVRFFKRLGSVPSAYNRRRASLRVLLAAKEMAVKAGVSLPEAYGVLCIFTSSKDRGLCLEHPECPSCPVSEFCKHASRKITAKDLPAGERPGERLLEKGAENLADSELLAIILGGDAIDLAQRLLATFGTLQRLEGAGCKELESINGIGKATAARIRAAFQLGRRSQVNPIGSDTSVRGSRQAFEHYRPKLANLKKEVFLCVLLDTRHRVIREEKVAVGSLNESIVHPREVFKRAVSESAHAVLFVHNHPSGDPGPSPQDYRLTERLKKAGDLMGIKVLDHIVVGKDSYYSFAEHGDLG